MGGAGFPPVAGTGGLILAAVAVLAGLALCYWGKTLFVAMLALLGFVVAWRVSAAVLQDMGSAEGFVRWASLAIGALGALLSGFVFRVYLFAAGGLAGWFLVTGWFPAASLLVRVAAVLVCGLLLFVYSDIFIIILAALAGALLVARGADVLLSAMSIRVPLLAVAGVCFLLAASGAIRQLRSRK